MSTNNSNVLAPLGLTAGAVQQLQRIKEEQGVPELEKQFFLHFFQT